MINYEEFFTYMSNIISNKDDEEILGVDYYIAHNKIEIPLSEKELFTLIKENMIVIKDNKYAWNVPNNKMFCITKKDFTENVIYSNYYFFDYNSELIDIIHNTRPRYVTRTGFSSTGSNNRNLLVPEMINEPYRELASVQLTPITRKDLTGIVRSPQSQYDEIRNALIGIWSNCSGCGMTMPLDVNKLSLATLSELIFNPILDINCPSCKRPIEINIGTVIDKLNKSEE